VKDVNVNNLFIKLIFMSQNTNPEMIKNRDNDIPQLIKKLAGFISDEGIKELKNFSASAIGSSELITGISTARECDTCMACRGQMFIQRIQLSQVSFQNGLLSIILIEAVGHFISHSLHVSQSVDAMNIFAK
jgi:hypothetical protein